jgi:hypothetical protein
MLTGTGLERALRCRRSSAQGASTVSGWDRIDTAFAQACTAAVACGPEPTSDEYPALCAVTGLYTEAVLRAAMDCLAQDCDRRPRCLANATFCHPNSPNDFCL